VGDIDQNRFLTYLTDPTFLNYSFTDATFFGGSDDPEDITNYNGTNDLKIDVNLADFTGEYELGKRDIAGGCVNLSLLKQKDIDDVC